MARPKPQWEHVSRLTRFTEPEAAFWSEVAGCVRSDHETFKTFRAGVRDALGWYQQRKSHGDTPTARELRAAAVALKDAADKIGALLVGDAGGLGIHLKNVLRHSTDPSLRETGLHLLHVASACQEIESWPDSKLVSLEKLSDPFAENDPRKNLAFYLAWLFYSVLDRKPTKTCTPEAGSRGQYAKVLAACLVQSDGHEPADLKKLVFAGVDSARATWEERSKA